MADNENKDVEPKKDSKINAFIQKHGKKKLIIGTCGIVAVIVLIVGLSVGLTTCNKGSGSTSSTSSSTTSGTNPTSSSSSTILPEVGCTPVFSSDKSTCTYGIYPQTYVSNTETIAALNSLNGPVANDYYVYNNSYYTKVESTNINTPSIVDHLTFSDGSTIVNGQTYWFKCEPITWKVIKSSNDEYTLLSSLLLDGHIISVSDTYDYSISEMRTWLNDSFYNKAFGLSNIQDSYIQTTEVDNSASTTGSGSTAFYCDNTFDKVYLPSYRDMMFNFGFNTTSDRICNNTDYLKANGGYCETNNNTYYWTRSPYMPGYFSMVDNDGSLRYMDGTNKLAVRPIINIKL